MQTIMKICAARFDKKSHHTFMVCLWICAVSAEYGIAALFAKWAAIQQNAPIFTGKVPQSKDCGALQDSALSGSAAHTEG